MKNLRSSRLRYEASFSSNTHLIFPLSLLRKLLHVALMNILKHTSGNKKAEEDANKEAEVQMKSIEEAGKVGKDKVVADLLNAVFNVKPQVPERVTVSS